MQAAFLDAKKGRTTYVVESTVLEHVFQPELKASALDFSGARERARNWASASVPKNLKRARARDTSAI